MPDLDNPYPGVFEIFWGDEFAFLVAASPIGMNLAVLSGPPILARVALPLLMLVQAVLVVADRWRLERMFPGQTAPPSLAWALFAPGYLFQRARALADLRYAPVIWLLMLLVMLLPFFMLMSDPQHPGAVAKACGPPVVRVHSEAAGLRLPGLRPTGSRDHSGGTAVDRVADGRGMSGCGAAIRTAVSGERSDPRHGVPVGAATAQPSIATPPLVGRCIVLAAASSAREPGLPIPVRRCLRSHPGTAASSARRSTPDHDGGRG